MVYLLLMYIVFINPERVNKFVFRFLKHDYNIINVKQY